MPPLQTKLPTVILSFVLYLSAISGALAAVGLNTGDANTALPIGAGGNVVMTVTPQSKVGIGTTTPAASLSVFGGVQVGTDMVCDDTKAGTLSYDSDIKQFKFCDGSVLQLIGGGEGGSYIVESSMGRCDSGNPLVPGHGCSCPAGYVAAATNKTTLGPSTGTFIGYTCFMGAAAPATVAAATRPQPVGHWTQDPGPEQWSCADTSPNSTPTPRPGYCNPAPLTNPCTIGQTNYAAAQCSYGYYSDCVGPGGAGNTYGWSLGYYPYSCVP